MSFNFKNVKRESIGTMAAVNYLNKGKPVDSPILKMVGADSNVRLVTDVLRSNQFTMTMFTQNGTKIQSEVSTDPASVDVNLNYQRNSDGSLEFNDQKISLTFAIRPFKFWCTKEKTWDYIPDVMKRGHHLAEPEPPSDPWQPNMMIAIENDKKPKSRK